MAKQLKKPVLSFAQILNQLQDISHPFPAANLHRFSDLKLNNLALLKDAWLKIPLDRRVSFLEDLEELAETDTVVSFDDIARFGLKDPDPRVRATSLRLLWESEDPRLAPVFIDMMENDADQVVRASAATAVGLFVYLGELEQIPSDLYHTVEDHLLAVEKGGDAPLVRRRALESLGYSGQVEVAALIKQAYTSGDVEWQASALFAMGRSADAAWEDAVVSRVESPDLEVQLQAVRAAGQLELSGARNALIQLLSSHPEELDEEVRAAAAWSLSQIGGEDARATLESLLENTEDDDEADYIEMALENLAFTEDIPGFGMFDAITNPQDHTQVVDLSDSDEDEHEDEIDLPDDDQPMFSNN
jgi:HEAT repeat protein